jgi:hypothetical protein
MARHRGVRARQLDHFRIEVETGHTETVSAREEDRQPARTASDFEDARPFGRHSGDICGDPLEQRSEQESVGESVVESSIADEDPAGDLPAHAAPAVSDDAERDAGRHYPKWDQPGSTSRHRLLDVSTRHGGRAQ